MIRHSASRLLTRLGFWALLLVVVGMVSLSSARQDAGKVRPKTEYLSQEVGEGAMATTMTDLDAMGWDIFQVVPIWKVQGEGGDASLVPRAYQVFARRAVVAK